MADQQPRTRPRLAPATVSPEAESALAELSEGFYAGKKSRAIDAALRAWLTVMRHPSTHGLASKPQDALQAYCEAVGLGDAVKASEPATGTRKQSSKAPETTVRKASLVRKQ